MKKWLLFLTFTLSVAAFWAQDVIRTEIKGVILSENQDVESVTIFNTSSNKGTITSEKGEFVLKVALNDRIEISALQFNPMSLVIEEDVVKSKYLRIYLVEQVNQLDAVVLSSGLSGLITEDIDNVKLPRSIELDMGDMNIAFEYNDDKAFDNKTIESAYNTTINSGTFYNGVNLVKIGNMFFKPKKKSDKNVTNQEPKEKDILDVYSNKYISETFHIPFDKVNAFLAYLDSKGIKKELLNRDNEIQLIDFLLKQRSLFLIPVDVKN